MEQIINRDKRHKKQKVEAILTNQADGYNTLVKNKDGTFTSHRNV